MTEGDDKRHSAAPGLGGKLNGQIDRAVAQWFKGDEKPQRAVRNAT